MVQHDLVDLPPVSVRPTLTTLPSSASGFLWANPCSSSILTMRLTVDRGSESALLSSPMVAWIPVQHARHPIHGGRLSNKMRTEPGVDTVELAHEVGTHLWRYRAQLRHDLHQVLLELMHPLGGCLFLAVSAHCSESTYISKMEIYHVGRGLSSIAVGLPASLLWLYFPMI